MRIASFVSTILLGCFISLFIGLVSADQEIDLLDESAAKEILLNKSWSCNLSDQYYTGPTSWIFETIKGKKVGGFSIWCNEKARVKGKLKKNTLKYTLSTPGDPNCNTSGILEFYRDADGLVKAKGHYRYSGTYATGKKGTIHECQSYED